MNLLLLLIIAILISPFLISQVSSSCDRLCGEQHVSYPFGFSDGCPIRLNCRDKGDHKDIVIGDFKVLNVTSDSLIVNLPARCNRSIGTARNLFNQNYALTLQNGLLLANCSTKHQRCKVPTTPLVETNFEFRGCDNRTNNNMSFFSSTGEEEDKGKNFMTFEMMIQSSCQILFSSISLDSSSTNLSSSSESAVSLQFQSLQLGWWLEGSCSPSSPCSENAICTDIWSPVNNLRSFRCRCAEGYDGDGFLAGEKCREDRPCNPSNYMSGRCGGRVGVLIRGAFAGVGGLIVIVIILFGIYARHKKMRRRTTVDLFLENYGYLSLQRYMYKDIKKMTKSFKEKLGQGGYGTVFKGKLNDGRRVAVKVLADDSEKGTNGEEFMNEVATIGRTNHVNIVALLGFCYSNSKRALVYEFMPNGSLEKFIYAKKENNTIIKTGTTFVGTTNVASTTTVITTTRQLGWEKLYQIALGIARGLEYLHRGCNTGQILHFDIKPHNILLDKNFCPKISDFGLAKLYPTRQSIVSMYGGRGTIGYIAPEVYCRNIGGVSYKSDVYSYGMMVLEMVGGRKNIDPFVDNISEIYFPHWIYDHLQDKRDRIEDFLRFEEVIEEHMAKKMILVGLWCIQTNPSHRPSMGRVAEMLEGRVEDLQMPPKPTVELSSQPSPPPPLLS